MFAIIKSGGKQYKVSEGTVIKLERLKGEIGESIDFNSILVLESNEIVKVGSPFVVNAKVTAEVLEQSRHKKINIIKFRRRKHSMKRQGHRQYYTKVKITSIKN